MKPAGTKPVPRLDGTELLMTPSKFISFLPFDICLHLRWLWKFLWCHALLVNLWYVGTQLSVGFQSFIKSQFPCFSPLIFIRILDGGKNVLMASWTLGESIWLSRARRTHFITAWPVKRDERPLKHFHAQRIGAQSDFAHRPLRILRHPTKGQKRGRAVMQRNFRDSFKHSPLNTAQK